MKKTLITLLTLGGLAVADTSTSLTLSSYIPTDTEYSGGGYRGIQFCLEDAFEAGRLTLNNTMTALPDTVVLTSFYFEVRSGNSHNGAYGVIVDSENKVVGSSSNAPYTATDGSTYNFTGVTLTSGETYKFVLSTGTREAGTTYESTSPVNLQMYRTGEADEASYLGALSGSNVNELKDTSYMPNVKISVKGYAIPEPTTATLSLLALAGLCARRRRK